MFKLEKSTITFKKFKTFYLSELILNNDNLELRKK
jgi:hypothetical protein